MVYSIVCQWLEDYLEGDEIELYDHWDFTEWVNESEIVDVFNTCLLNTFTRTVSKRDAESIFYSLLWEYYLLRRDLYIGKLVPDPAAAERLVATVSLEQKSQEWLLERRNLLTASEFYIALDVNKARQNLIKNKIATQLVISHDEPGEQTVFLSRDGRLNAIAWGHRYEPIIRSIYEKSAAQGTVVECGRFYHRKLDRLAASPDGIVTTGSRAGRLLEIKAPISRAIQDDIIPEPYYIQMQIQMEVCDVGAVDYCECRISAGPTWKLPKGGSVGNYVGAVAVVGTFEESSKWVYCYSPLYENTNEGRASAESWTPEGNVLEKHLWEIEKIQTLTVLRNPRWWNMVGLPTYVEFWKNVTAVQNDPLFLSPAFLDDEIAAGGSPLPVGPMFVD